MQISALTSLFNQTGGGKDMSFLSMNKVLIKNFIHGPSTILYPLNKKDTYDNTRGKVENTISDCIFCGMCQRRCPAEAIVVDKLTSTWSIDRFKCIQCNYCVEVCPKKCLSMNSHYTDPSYKKTRDEIKNA